MLISAFYPVAERGAGMTFVAGNDNRTVTLFLGVVRRGFATKKRGFG